MKITRFSAEIFIGIFMVLLVNSTCIQGQELPVARAGSQKIPENLIKVLLPEKTSLSATSNKSSAIEEKNGNAGWQVILSENFESGFPQANSWHIEYSNDSPYFWDDVEAFPNTGNRSAWCAGGTIASRRTLDPYSDNYANNMNTWMIYGPFDLSDASDAKLDFSFNLNSEAGKDKFWWLASTHDDQRYYGYYLNGNTSGYRNETFDLKNVFTRGDLTGHSQVYIAFLFQSDAATTSKGVFLDDVVLRKYAPSSNLVNVTFKMDWINQTASSHAKSSDQQHEQSSQPIFIIDGVSYFDRDPIHFSWPAGSAHTVEAGGMVYNNTICKHKVLFEHWKDGTSSRSRQIITPESDTEFTALYEGLVWFTLVGPSRQSLPDGYHPIGTTIRCEALPPDGYRFKEWKTLFRDEFFHYSSTNPLYLTLDICQVNLFPEFEPIQETRDDFQVNDFDNREGVRQRDPTIGADDNGNFVIAWSDGRNDQTSDDIYAQRYNKSVNALGPNFKVNDDTTPYSDSDPVIDVQGNGNFIICWVDERHYEFDIYGQRFSAEGGFVGNNFKANDDRHYEHFFPGVTVGQDGRFSVVWGEEGYYDIIARQFDENGQPLAANFLVNSTSERKNAIAPVIASSPDGFFVICWSAESGIYFQRFTRNGLPLGSNFRAIEGNSPSSPALAMHSNGNFIIAWANTRNSNDNIYAQRYNNDGSAQGDAFKVSNNYGNTKRGNPELDIATNGDFVICWSDERNGDLDIYAQRYDRHGTAIGSNYRVNGDSTETDQYDPDVAISNRKISFTWVDKRRANRGANIFAKVEDFPTSVSPVLIAPVGGETWIVASTHTIKWQNFGTGKVDLEYLREENGAWYAIASGIDADKGEFNWTIPEMEASHIKIRIRKSNDHAVFDTSNSIFIIPAATAHTFQTDFEDNDLRAFALRLPSSWKIKDRNGSKALCIEDINRNGNEYSVLQGYHWTDFKLEMDATAGDALSTVNENYFIMFGVQDVGAAPSNAYYLIFETGSAKLWRSISGQPTVLVATKNGDFVSGGSHRIRIERTGARILVYVDNALVFDLNDSKIGGGAIGFGSFKGTACFDNLVITADSDNSDAITENFEDGTADGWVPQTKSRWDIVRDEGSWRYFLNTTDYQADGKSPGEMSIYERKEFGGFVFECDLKSADAANGNALPDLDIIYGYQDARNYYFVMFNGERDDTAIYRVENGVRTQLDKYKQSTLEDGGYHHIKIIRSGNKVTVYYDSRKILEASDGTFRTGKIAVGSLNDSGYFDNIVIRGEARPAGSTGVVSIPSDIVQFEGEYVDVPIYISTESSISGAQFTVEYDKEVMKFHSASPGRDAGGFSITQQNNNPPFPPNNAELNKNVLVRISGGGNSISGTQQEILLLRFMGAGLRGDKTKMVFDQECAHTFLTTTTFDDVCGMNLKFIDGSVEIDPEAAFHGSVAYGSTERPVKDVLVELTGVAQDKKITNSEGNFFFEEMRSGDYTFHSSKSGDLRNAISGADVLSVLQALSFVASLSSEQKLTADVNGSGTVTGADAVALLRYLAFLTDGTAQTGRWLFLPNAENITLDPYKVRNIKAYLLGDITLNWGENNLMKSVSGGDFLFFPAIEQEKMSIALVAGQSSGRVNTGTLTLDWVDAHQKEISFQPAGAGMHFAVNNEDGKTTHLAFANVSGFSKGEKIGTFVIAGGPGEGANARIASMTSGTINDVALPEKEILLGDVSSVPDRYELFQNYPNPFNMQTAIKYAVPALDGSQKVSLKIFSIRGRLLKTLFEGAVEPGEHAANWDGTDDTGKSVSTGIYVAQLKSNSFSKSIKITVIK